jgi:hypothetical protein
MVSSVVKVALSLLALFVGWAAAFLTMVVFLSWSSSRGGVADFDFLLWWPLLFALLGWAIFGIPLILKVPLTARPMRFPLNFVTGVLLSSAAYWVLIGWATWRVWYLHIFAALVGLVAVPTFVALSLLLEPYGRKYAALVTLACLLLPPALFLSFEHLVWPAVEHRYPTIAYSLGSLRSQARVLRHVLLTTRAGDSFEKLHARLPQMFPKPFVAMSGSGYGYSYEILMENNQVKEIKLQDDQGAAFSRSSSGSR